jgi:hypothetical protein
VKFEVKQQIEGSVDEVERAFLDERYVPFLLANHGVLVEAQVLERQDDGKQIRRKVRYLPKPVIENIGGKTVPPEWFAFVESSTYDKERKQLTFENVPTSSKISGMLTNTGVLRLRASGRGTERTVEGDIKLHLPFFLKPVAMIGERVIQHEGVKILDGEVPVLNRFIAEVVRK